MSQLQTVDREILVSARWEAETTYLIANLIRSGVPPSELNIERLALSCKRLTNVIRALGGDRREVVYPSTQRDAA